MKTKFIKRGLSGLMAVWMAVTAFIGLGHNYCLCCK